MKFDPVTTEKGAVEKAAEVLVAFGWMTFFAILPCSPVAVWAVWKALL